MSNGEKTIPAPLESALLAQPAVKGAVAFGQGQDRIGVLIELKEDIQSSRDITAMRNLLWYVV
jgi:long-subunit acyl-CoA synthetase (AMP-forming)